MKLTHEKLVHLSHVIVDALEKHPTVELRLEHNEVRLSILNALKDAMKLEDEIEATVRRKITSQRRQIVEGSREWDLLQRKYYEEEAARHRKVR